MTVNVVLSAGSKSRLGTCDPRLQSVINGACKNSPYDFLIVFGHRTEEQQNSAFNCHKSPFVFPNSKHNANPSLALDFAPLVDHQIPWADLDKFKELAAHIKAVAHELNIPIIWGGDYVHSRPDWDHIELPDEWPKKELEHG